tara:strand:+ start:1970 stop:3121 length:1152 start_codon:yes stop_codon:yes gene_type:complete
MKVLILGGDGYLGWPTAMSFSQIGHEVCVVDNFSKRKIELENGIEPLLPIAPLHKRINTWNKNQNNKINIEIGSLMNHRFVYGICERYKPEVIIHYAEQPSAPYSMKGREEAVYTQENNIVGNINLLFAIKSFCPDAHLIKLGTMGVYGTPNIDIEEGFIDIVHNGRKDKLPFPKQPLSFYHLSKSIDSQNIEFVCKTWQIRSTDLNQGVVYGLKTQETELHKDFNTSFHYDSIFGTVINRFLTLAATGNDMLVYGEGNHKRTFLNLLDTIQCVKIASENPPNKGEYRVFNQFTEVFSIMELAELVKIQTKKKGISASIKKIINPRVEKSNHYFNPKNENFLKLGLKPRKISEVILNEMIDKIIANKDNVNKEIIFPEIKWKK